MSEWEFLYEMRDHGSSTEDIADAAATGVAPWEWKYIDRDVGRRVASTRARGGCLLDRACRKQRWFSVQHP